MESLSTNKVDFSGNPMFSLALDLVEQTGKNVFLTGRAGTGKTTFLRTLRERAVKRMIVVAPTGIAAINAGGVTMHSFFQLSFGLFLPGFTRKNKFKFSQEKIDIIRRLDLLVIDEVSMLRADLLDEVSRVLQRYRHSSQPFGGVQLLLIGDLYQLSPIVREDEWEAMKAYYPSPYFFDSRELRTVGFESVELTHIYRQTNAEFIYLLEKVRQRKLDPISVGLLQSRYMPGFQPSDEEGYVTLTTHNYQSERINQSKLDALGGRMYTFEAEVKGEFPESSFPTASRMDLKAGAQVMFIKNDPLRRYYNGKIGKIIRCSDDAVWVDCEGVEIEVSTEVWENKKYVVDKETHEIKEEVDGEFFQLPLKLAWAITIHKSQGLTFDKVIIDAGRSFAPGQVYVALSRCRSLDGVILQSPLDQRALIDDTYIDCFCANRDFQPKAEDVDRYKQQYRFGLLRDQFDFSSMWGSLSQLQEIAYTSYRKLYSRLEADIRQMVFRFGQEIYEVSEKFIRQLYQMYSQPQGIIDERCIKAAGYFLEKIDQIVQPVLPRLTLDVESENQAEILGKIRKELRRLVAEKRSTLQLLLNSGTFRIREYLRAKSLDAPVRVKDASASVDGKENDCQQPKTCHSSSSQGNSSRKTSSPVSHVKEENMEIQVSSSQEDIPHPELFQRLKQWRKEKCTEKSLPAYLILSQKAIIGICQDLPETENTLLKMHGIGKVKLKNYGEEILDMVKSYKQENNLK